MKRKCSRFFCGFAAVCLMLTLTACKNGGSAQSSEAAPSSSAAQEAESGQSSADPEMAESAAAQESGQETHTAAADESSALPETKPGGSEDPAQENTSAATSVQPGSTAQTATQTAVSTVDRSDPPVETEGEFYGENITAAPGAKHVPVTVSIRNNPGIASLGVRITYDAALKPILISKLDSEFENGTVTAGIASVCACNEKKHLVGYTAGIGAAELTADGSLFTCYFDVPEDAKSGTVYQFTIEGKGVINLAGADLTLSGQPFTLTVK